MNEMPYQTPNFMPYNNPNNYFNPNEEIRKELEKINRELAKIEKRLDQIENSLTIKKSNYLSSNVSDQKGLYML